MGGACRVDKLVLMTADSQMTTGRHAKYLRLNQQSLET